MSRAPSSVRQRQTGQVAAVAIGYQDGCQLLVDPEQLKKAKLHVEKAIKEKKIFALQGPYPIIRRLLRARGWVERKLPRKGRQLKQQLGGQKKQQLEKTPSDGGGERGQAVLSPHGGAQPSRGTTEPLHYPWPYNEEEEEDKEEKKDKEQCNEDPDDIHDLMSYLVRDQVPNFLWTIRLGNIDQELLQKVEVVNRYRRVHALSTKEGLCLSLQNLSWFEQVDPNTFFPRCYRLGIVEEEEAFIEDFRLTAARSLLKLALEKAGNGLVEAEQPPKSNKRPAEPGSPLSPRVVEEALEVCEQHLGILGHQDIDRKTPSPCRSCIDWDHFLQDYYCVAHEGAELALSGAQREQCQDLLQRLGKQLPQLSIEGNRNIWILKPSAKSRGRGIICATRLQEVLELAQSYTAPSVCEWVVQKYVERPLTVFGTKFDIRQWFLVTDWMPLTVWFYRDCYLRFCSQPFSLHCLEPARHLCNVSIQKKYKTLQQDPRVPSDKTWSNKQFQAYLARLGRGDAWHQVLVPGMKAAILSALRCAQHQVGFRKGSFELFGADFLVGEDFQPWLLEINSCPTMSPSTAVTRRLCANVQRDTLSLVLDHKDNPSCSIGAFELLCKEAAMPTCLTVGLNLMVKGSSLKKPQPEKHRPQDKPPTTTPSAPQLPMPPGDRATNVPWSRAAWEKLPPLRPQSNCCPRSSDPPALPQPPECSAGSQELPWLLHLVGQPKEAQPQDAQPQASLPGITTSPLDRGPVPPAQGAARSLCRPPSCVPGSQELPWLLHLDGQPQDAEPQEALPPITSRSLDRVPVPWLQKARRSPWRPPGSSAGSQGLPQLSHPGGQPRAARSHTDVPRIRDRPPMRVPVPPPRGAPSSPWRPSGCSPVRAGLPARPLHRPTL